MFHRVLNTPLISIRFTYVKFYHKKKTDTKICIILINNHDLLLELQWEKKHSKNVLLRNLNSKDNKWMTESKYRVQFSAYLNEYDKFTGFNIKILKYYGEISLKNFNPNIQFIFHLVIKNSVFSHFSYTILSKEN